MGVVPRIGSSWEKEAIEIIIRDVSRKTEELHYYIVLLSQAFM